MKGKAIKEKVMKAKGRTLLALFRNPSEFAKSEVHLLSDWRFQLRFDRLDRTRGRTRHDEATSEILVEGLDKLIVDLSLFP